VTGSTVSTDFPITTGAFQTVCGTPTFCKDAFVTKLNPDGSGLVYSTYLGGSGGGGPFGDLGAGIAVDSAGNAYVTGTTFSSDFPTENALQPSKGERFSTLSDAFITKLNPEGSALIYSTYLGGRQNDVGSSIAVDTENNVYITGDTDSTNFPVVDPPQPFLSGGKDVFVAKINETASALIYSTYLGGTGGEQAKGIAVDGSGNAYVTGLTSSTDFPTETLQASGGGTDAFVAKIGPPPDNFSFTQADLEGTWLGSANSLVGGFFTMTISFDELGNVTGGSTSFGGTFTGDQLSINSSTGVVSGTILLTTAGVTISCTMGADSKINAAKTLFTGSANCSDGDQITSILLTRRTFSLTVSKAGSGSGTVTSNRGGIDCGGRLHTNLRQWYERDPYCRSVGGFSVYWLEWWGLHRHGHLRGDHRYQHCDYCHF